MNPITNKVYTSDQYCPQVQADSSDSNEEDEEEVLEENDLDEVEASKENNDLFAEDIVRYCTYMYIKHLAHWHTTVVIEIIVRYKNVKNTSRCNLVQH